MGRRKNGVVAMLVDEEGNKVPAKYIDPVVLERHELVEGVISKVREAEETLKKLKKELFEAVQNHLDKTADVYGENWKGNASLMNFGKTRQVDLKISKMISFDERLNIAKTKIDDCLNRWSNNAKHELKTLVLKAFNVDKKGNVDSKQILSLRQYKFDDPVWKEAMSIIDEALTTVGTREYMNFSERADSRSDWKKISLNFSALERE
jgi:hypothetical protein